jgi:hypothetical protein
MPYSLIRCVGNSLRSKGQANHGWEGIEGLQVGLSTTTFSQHLLMDIQRRIMTHVHCTSTALDAGPGCEISHGIMMLCMRKVARELQSIDL